MVARMVMVMAMAMVEMAMMAMVVGEVMVRMRGELTSAKRIG